MMLSSYKKFVSWHHYRDSVLSPFPSSRLLMTLKIIVAISSNEYLSASIPMVSAIEGAILTSSLGLRFLRKTGRIRFLPPRPNATPLSNSVQGFLKYSGESKSKKKSLCSNPSSMYRRTLSPNRNSP